MFILRKFNRYNIQENIILGDHYTLLTFEDSKEFEQFMTDKLIDCDDIVAFVIVDNENYHEIYGGQSAYIMNENGKTFANISLDRINDGLD